MSYNEYIEEELGWHSDESLRRRTGVTEKTLRIPIRHVPPREPVLLGPTATVFDAMIEMQREKTGAVLVDMESFFGIITERDVIMKVPGRGRLSTQIPITEAMTPNPVTLHRDDTIAFAMNYMAVGGYRHIPIVDDAGKPVGLLSVRDLMRFIVDFFPEEVLALPPKPRKGGAPRYGG
jgi:CBS domain-containing protein